MLVMFVMLSECRITLSSLPQLMVIMTVNITKWLLMVKESFNYHCFLILREQLKIRK